MGAFIYPNGVELILQSADFNRFRRAGAVVGLEVYLVEAQKDIGYMQITGSWREIAATIRRVIGEMYNIGEGTEVDVDVLG
ncbi:MAG: hypothetical protein QOF89_3523 [Acidobacteriota bacterium]|nr:hypothetical protein [Acidobacteriota bacterium]